MTTNATKPNDMETVGTFDFHFAVFEPHTRARIVMNIDDAVKLEAVGRARCNKDDQFEPEVGARIAAGRALADLGKQLEANGLSASRPKIPAELQDALSRIVRAFDETIREIVRGDIS